MARRPMVIETRPNGTCTVRLKHRLLVDALMLSMELEERHEAGLVTRLRQLSKRMSPTTAVEAKRGPDLLYSLRDALDIALALHLQRGFVSERASAEAVKRNSALLDQLWWRSLIKMESFTVQIAVDAFEPRGRRDIGASATFETSELRIARRDEPTSRRPVVTFDASEIADRLVEALTKLGVTAADMDDLKRELTS